jgi:predicted chitinase
MTTEQLRAIMPRLSDKRTGELLPFLNAAMTEFGIEAPSRAAAFLAQLAHESGEFRFMEEIWGPTDAQRRYEPTTKLSEALGNTEAGDGRLFKGRGPIQLTGRANYRRFGDLLSVDLVADPPQAAKPDVAFRIAGLFWSRKGLNELADLATDDAFKEITRRINGGTNGLADRQKFYAMARQVLGVSSAPLAQRGARSMSAPLPEPESSFERGSEAVRAYAPKLHRPAKRKARKPAARRKTTSGRRRKTATKGARRRPVRARRKKR